MSSQPLVDPWSMPYETYYGFVQAPFTLTPDPRFLYRSGAHDEVLSQLLGSLRRREGFIVMTGDIGTGKTTTCRALMQQLDANTFTSLVLNPFLSVEDLLREALLDFGVLSREAVRSGRAASASTHELVSALHDFLLSLIPIKGSAVLIIDEAQHLSSEVLEQIRVLSNLETNESKLLQIILVGQLNLLDSLESSSMRQLSQRVSIKTSLRPLSREEVEAYVNHRLWIARGSEGVKFDAEAFDCVHLYSGGVPRVINLLCDRSLMAGAAERLQEIPASIIRKAAERLHLEEVPAIRAVLSSSRSSRRRKQAGAAALAVLFGVAGFLILVPSVWISTPDRPPVPPKLIAEPVRALPPPPGGLLPPLLSQGP